jgi:hypothetical protein
MTVEIRQAGDEWLVEVHGQIIGSAETRDAAQALGDFWKQRLECIARWRSLSPRQRGDLPEALTRLLAANSA